MKKTILAGTVALALIGSGAAFAQQAPSRDAPQWRPSAEDIAALTDARIAALKAGLKLSANQEKNWPAVETAIRDLVRAREPRKVKIEDIQKLVATHYNVSRADILSSRRSAGVVKPRQVAMYLSKILTLRSLPEIGRRFGGRDHTTVLHAVRKIGAERQQMSDLNQQLHVLEQTLKG